MFSSAIKQQSLLRSSSSSASSAFRQSVKHSIETLSVSKRASSSWLQGTYSTRPQLNKALLSPSRLVRTPLQTYTASSRTSKSLVIPFIAGGLLISTAAAASNSFSGTSSDPSHLISSSEEDNSMSSKLVPSNPSDVMVIRDITPNVVTLSVPFSRFGKLRVGGRGTVGKFLPLSQHPS